MLHVLRKLLNAIALLLAIRFIALFRFIFYGAWENILLKSMEKFEMLKKNEIVLIRLVAYGLWRNLRAIIN